MLSPRRAVRLAFVSRRQGAVFRYARRTPSPNGGMRRALRSTTRIEAGAQSIAAEYPRCRRCTGAARAGTAGAPGTPRAAPCARRGAVPPRLAGAGRGARRLIQTSFVAGSSILKILHTLSLLFFAVRRCNVKVRYGGSCAPPPPRAGAAERGDRSGRAKRTSIPQPQSVVFGSRVRPHSWGLDARG